MKTKQTPAWVVVLGFAAILLATVAAFQSVVWQKVFERSWDLRDGRKLTIARHAGVAASDGWSLRLEHENTPLLRIPEVLAPNKEVVEPKRVGVVESKSGLIGVLVHTRIFWIYPDRVKSLPRTWTESALSDCLSCVIDPQTKRYWKVNAAKGEAIDEVLQRRFVEDFSAAGIEDLQVLSGIDYANIEGDAVRPEIVASLSVFPDLHDLSVENRLDQATIDALHSLRNVRKVWFEYIEFDADTLKALGRLDDLSCLTIRKSGLATIPDADAIIVQLRKELPQTQLLVVDAD